MSSRRFSGAKLHKTCELSKYPYPEKVFPHNSCDLSFENYELFTSAEGL